MKLIIAGSRTLDVPYEFIGWCIHKSPFKGITEIVSGGAHGIDESAMDYADFYELKWKILEAKWEAYGPAAGPIRNREMAEYGDGLLLIWDGQSRGSANMKEQMLKLNKPIHEILFHVANNAIEPN